MMIDPNICEEDVVPERNLLETRVKAMKLVLGDRRAVEAMVTEKAAYSLRFSSVEAYHPVALELPDSPVTPRAGGERGEGELVLWYLVKAVVCGLGALSV